jgi:hypothetical protein
VCSQKRSSVENPWEVESPFLDRELFLAVPEEERQARAATTAEESPFFKDGSGAITEPETGELYSASNYPASDAFDDREVSGKLTADGFVADNDGREYFVAFPQLGDLAVKKATILTPSNFESLMDLMLASNQENSVIDAHGEPKGLFMPLASATKISATKHSGSYLSCQELSTFGPGCVLLKKVTHSGDGLPGRM